MKPEDIDRIEDLDALKALLRELIGVIEALRQTIERKEQELAELRRLLFGPKSERLPSVQSELKKRRDGRREGADPEQTAAKRQSARRARRELPTEEVVHEVGEQELRCPHCGGTEFVDLPDEVSFEYEFVPSRLLRRRHLRQKKACRCGQHIVTAPGPARVSEGVQYGPGLHAHVVVAKCLDSLPLYRQAQALSRAGVKMQRSTLCDLFHRSAELLEPLHRRMLELIKASRYVRADETPQPVLDKGKTHRGYMWNFNTDEAVAYVFSEGRSGETPAAVLGASGGFLQTDDYSGYNRVTTPEGRTRVGCWAHVRRKFFEAKELAPEECGHALDAILNLYEVEYRAAEENILGSERHLAMRRSESRRIVEAFREWLDAQKERFAPRSPMGQAVGYALNHWATLIRFLEDANLPLDNNMSERLLRVIALGRKNFLFVGHNGAGHNLAVLQSLVSTCQINGVDPQAYLTDVLIRIQTHPRSRIDELLPQCWQPP